MKNKPYDLIIYIGRFQPFHIAHQETIRVADTLAKNVLVLVGSADNPRTIKDPWTTEERMKMILSSTHVHNLFLDKIYDYLYDDNKWIEAVGRKIESYITFIKDKNNINYDLRIAIIGYDKDHSSFYLNYFPQWEFREMSRFPASGETIDSTKIRELLFKGDHYFTKGVLPIEVAEQINRDIQTDWFRDLKYEFEYIENYKKAWKSAPYPPIFTTTDAIVVQSGHILLIERGEYPGIGLLAMPGGFLNVNERLREGVIRELCEETGLKVPKKVLQGSIKDEEVYDVVNRSTRGRTITHAYYIKLDDSEKLPRIKGGDDAKKAFWLPLSELSKIRSKMYEDHWYIIHHMLNRN